MIGCIGIIVTPYYDSENKKNSFKKRPALIVSGPRNNDYTVLPISSISKKENIDEKYDIKIEPEEYPLLNLKKISYIRTHKQTIVHQNSITDKPISSLKDEYKDLYENVIASWMEFEYEAFGNSLD